MAEALPVDADWEVIPSMSIDLGQRLKESRMPPGMVWGPQSAVMINPGAAEAVLRKLQAEDAQPGTVHFIAETTVPAPEGLFSPARMLGYQAVAGLCSKNKDGSSTVRIGLISSLSNSSVVSADELRIIEAHELQHSADLTSPSINRLNKHFWRKLNWNPRYFVSSVLNGAMQLAADKLLPQLNNYVGMPTSSENISLFKGASLDYAKKATFHSPHETRAYQTGDDFDTNPAVISFENVDSEN